MVKKNPTTEKEIWKETKYRGVWVSNLGRVRSYRGQKKNPGYRSGFSPILKSTSHILKTHIDPVNGYFRVDVKDKKQKYHTKQVHRLVLETFCRTPQKSEITRHLDGNKLNNRLENLKWGTCEENKEDERKHTGFKNHKKEGQQTHHKFTKKTVKRLRQFANSQFFTRYELCQIFRCSRSTVMKIVNRCSWKSVQ